MKEFVHLHVHTQYSLLDGAIRFEPLFDLAKKYGMPACSITDHGNMFGVIDFYFSAKEVGIKPIIGCEAYISPKSRFDKKTKGEDNAYHVILLAMNNNGYKNLVKLISIAQLEGFYYVPRIDKEVLKAYNEDLICLTACIKGEIPNNILKGTEKALKESIEEYLSIFGDRLFFELQDNGIAEQRTVNERLIELSRYYNIPVVATNDCHYLKKDEARAHELLLCIQTRKKLSDKDRMSFQTDEFYFKSPDEMYNGFSGYPEALKNTIRIAEMCNVEIKTGVYHFPEFTTPDNLNINEYLEKKCRDGFERKLDKIKASYKNFNDEILEEYRRRLEYELNVIKNTNFAGYFLIVSDFINYAKEKQIPVGPGRGSAAGSLIAYCLGITDIDPIKYNLLFERFLNPERVSMPDIDVDFCKKRRDEVIQYVTEKYGKENVAQIITFGTMQSRAAVRDVGRALGMPLAEVDRIAKLIPLMSKSIRHAIETEPQLKQVYESDRNVKELLDYASTLEGLARHASTHAAGIVISNKDLTEYLPLYRGQKGETVTQYPMKTIEKIGLIKIDFLGLETLTLMHDVIEMLKKDGIEVDIDKIPLDDKKTYELLSSGDTSGVFQLESRGMKDLLVKLKPSKFEDIMPLIALYRPGPLKSGMVEEFIRRKNNPSLIKYELPYLEDILKETYGVIIYQEQIMKIAEVLAGFSIKDADALRKAMAKKIPEELERYSEQFVKGAVSKGINKETAEKIYNIIKQFGEYGFNKSHSTAYGLIAYQTAYLKANYYIYYLTAMLTTEVNNTDKLIKYITECREAGIEILPPDINKSDKFFKIENNKIRFGLAGIKNVGDAALDNIIAVREKIGGFKSFGEFCESIDSRKVNKKVLESLAKAGCFDSMGLKRSQVLHLIKERVDKSIKRNERAIMQASLFDMDDEVHTNGYFFQIPEMEELSYRELLAGEKEAFGFYFTQHPLEPYEKFIKIITEFDTQSIKEMDIQEDIDLVGVINSFKEITTKKGDRMAYVNLEDKKGIIEAIVFPEVYTKSIEILKGDKPIVVSGSIEKVEEGTAKIRTKKITLLEDIVKKMENILVLRLDCKVIKREEMRRLKEILTTIKGYTKVFIELQLNGDIQRIKIPEIRIDRDKIDILTKHFEKGLKIYEIRGEQRDEILS
ncbi:MAG: DNA polymerase III subunit alpha [Syntrophorhabdaceae bacterium]|nr:DNA polymerase III subunit alpha [Syntrophorhabdaceae bacterium]